MSTARILANLTCAALLVQLALGPSVAHAKWGFPRPKDDPEGEAVCARTGAVAGVQAHCDAAVMDKKAADADTVAFVGYTAAAVTCAATCFYNFNPTPCKVASWGMVAAELGTAHLLAKDGEQHLNALKENYSHMLRFAAPIHGALGATAVQFGMDWLLERAVAKGAEAGANNADKTTSEQAEWACYLGAAINAAQAIMRNVNAHRMYDQAYSERQQAIELEGTTELARDTSERSLGYGGAHYGNLSGQGNAGGDFATKQSGAAGKKTTGSDIVQSAAKQGYGDVLKNFENTFKKPASELGDRILAGQHPFQMAAELSGAKLTDAQKKRLADVDKGAQDLVEQLKKRRTTLASTSSVSSYQASAVGASSKTKSSAIPDFSKLFGGGSKQPSGAVGPKALEFNTARSPASQSAEEGLYLSTVDLFQVVGERYGSMSDKFLNGDNVLTGRTPAAASDMPANPYLQNR